MNLKSPTQFIDAEFIKRIQAADYSICNFEGPVVDASVNTIPYALRQHGSTIDSLASAGFDLLLLANNHICDYGEKGVIDTQSNAKAAGLDYMGAGLEYDETYNPFIKSINGIKFGFINLSTAQTGQFDKPYLKYGYAWMGDKIVESRIISLKEKVDYIILFCHVGYEGCSIPLEEIRNLYRHYCDLGVNCIIGSHPHVPQGCEHYGNSIIFYSLGNFYFPENIETGKEQESYSVLLQFEKDMLDYEIVYHKTSSGVVYCAKEGELSFTMQGLNEMLEPELYDHLKEKMYEEGFAHYYELYKWCLSPNKRSIKTLIKKMITKANDSGTKQLQLKAWLKLTQCEAPNYILSHYLSKMMGQ